MNTESVLVRLGGVVMLGVFAINLYIGLYDTNLSQISPVHEQLNWMIAGADLLAAVFLLVKPRNLILKSLGGIMWPIFYIANLFIDVETRLCLGAAQNTCSPTISTAYQYLILGSADQEWVLWPYTIRLAIGLAVVVLILSLLSLKFRAPSKKSKSLPFQNNQNLTSEQDQPKNNSTALRSKFRGKLDLGGFERDIKQIHTEWSL